MTDHITWNMLIAEVKDLSELVKKLVERIGKLEVSGGGKSAAPAAHKPAAKPKDDDDDDGVDLFGSDSEVVSKFNRDVQGWFLWSKRK